MIKLEHLETLVNLEEIHVSDQGLESLSGLETQVSEGLPIAKKFSIY